MNVIENKKIAIIGAGPGGLTLARLLQMNGADVKVYERDLNKDARPKGATLDLHEESGLAALQEAGLMEAFMANYRPGADKMRITDKNARVVFDDHDDAINNPSRPEIDRGPLQMILLDSLQPDTVVWNSYIMSLNKLNNQWELAFQNGESITADIVIAADGANSKIRSYITPIKPFYSGITIVEGQVYDAAHQTPEIHKLINGGKIFGLGNDERSLIVSSKGDGSLVFYTGCKTGENWVNECGIDFKNNAQVTAWFKKEFADWDKVWLKLFEHAGSSFVPRPQYCMPFDQAWEPQSNLTMIGDAAHLMPPYAGEGVNMAMQDALELSRCLNADHYMDVHSAIADFENQMRGRASEIARQTMESTNALHSTSAIAYMLNMFKGN
ncbi:FAD-dependent oxidoreductase [Mucilaginibacter sp. FT3.2]|uniref:FAD-dependent oxidoreductase n=1 Tax=Mucilaginibacter sp. FT3.2 TaxID=2723090 RepID=UPI0016159FF7|nr:NAD(P)/FAD-dependent oxidoreductase [Mucilaginibacter sp. FT3.2]MBB6231649.1 2-polyprenyl-6-methoxyphenol hydroxylase-like FAD-dependent oxidoreductase [Mucilaginibacter sp. FT3.2]